MQSVASRLVLIGMLPLTLLIARPGAPAPPLRRSAPVPSLDRTTWVLQRYGERGRLTRVLPGAEVTLVFDRRHGRVGGSAGCNSYFAGVRFDGARLAVSDVGATKKFCGQPDGVMAQESRYLETLRAAERYQIRGNRLRVFAPRDQILVFRTR